MWLQVHTFSSAQIALILWGDNGGAVIEEFTILLPCYQVASLLFSISHLNCHNHLINAILTLSN